MRSGKKNVPLSTCRGQALETERYFIALFALQTLLRPATIADTQNPSWSFHLNWKGKTYVYDSRLGEILLADASGSSSSCDGAFVTLRTNALMLPAGASVDPRLRALCVVA